MTASARIPAFRLVFALIALAGVFALACPGNTVNTDDDAPVVLAISPAADATDISVSVTPMVTFDRAMDSATVLAAFQLVGVSASVATDDDTTFTLTPDQPLQAGTQYTLRVEASAADPNGRSIAALVTQQFTTEMYPGPPSVVSVDPPHAAVGVLPNASVTVVFSEPMDAASVEQAFALVQAGGQSVAGVLTTTDDTTFVFQPSRPMAKGATFTVNLAITAVDASGLSLPTPWSSTFSTADGPEVIAIQPADGAVAVPVSPGTVVISFDRDMNAATLTSATITLAEVGTGVLVPTTVTGFGALPPYRAFVDPVATLLYGTEYEVTVSTACLDTLGNPLLAPLTATFTTRPDPALGPIVLAVTPPDAATDVPTSTQVTVTFDSAMNEATLTPTNVRLENAATGSLVTSMVQPITVGTTLCFVLPQSLLATGTDYRVRVTTACMSQAGQALVLEHVSTFTTEAVSMPEVVAIIPADGATGVSPLTNVQVAFNREMNPATLNAGTVQLRTLPGGIPVLADLTVSTLLGSTAVTLQPQSPLGLGAPYQVFVSASVADTGGNTLGTDVTSSFTTATPTIDPALVGQWGNAASQPSEVLSIDVGGAFHHYDVFSYGYQLINIFGQETLIIQTGGPLGSTFLRAPGGGTPGSIVGAWVDPLSQSALLIAAGSYAWTHLQTYPSGSALPLIETGPLADRGSTLLFKRDAPGMLTQPGGTGTYAIDGQRGGYTYGFSADATTLEFDGMTWTRQGAGTGLAGTWVTGNRTLTFASNTAGAYELAEGDVAGSLVDRSVQRGSFAAAAGVLTFTASLGGTYIVDASGPQDVLRLFETDDPWWEISVDYTAATDALLLFGESFTRTAGTPGSLSGTWEVAGKEYTFDETTGEYTRTVNGQTATGAFTVVGDRLELTLYTRWLRQ